jgi:predicted GNAT family N-acyltransferase
VDEQYQNRGIGKKLFDYALNEINNMYPGNKEITVNSSIFAEKIYTKLGFEKTAELQEQDGIQFIPMRYTINN